MNAVDPRGLLVLTFEVGGGAGAGLGGNQSNTPNYFSGSTGTFFGSSTEGGSTSGTFETGGAGNTLGGAAGYGVVIGAYFGDAQEMSGQGADFSIITPIISATISKDQSGNYGFNLGFGGRGWGLGTVVQETHTAVQANWQSQWDNPCP